MAGGEAFPAKAVSYTSSAWFRDRIDRIFLRLVNISNQTDSNPSDFVLPVIR